MFCSEEQLRRNLLEALSFSRRGYGKAMLARAIELNRPNGMTVLIETGNTAAAALYESLGFDRVDGGNSVTAHVILS